ncbi:YggS family pyridoxal phosphate-dependent enzyme [Streptomyces gardneri]|uniref:YggS family pyridoxal phosphate-dependent enzyme n=1 Tax=Nocardia sputi TaxID=2943705 RepID=UPI0018955E09|nr:YggS family pyridoxal phosphate-dependent enzyme [Nocardia sputi]MBF6169340.1 YggS family pyridoxal phosphate-dependent enzyme [Streptomyces gardneri]MBF6208930.1 YggS family pyridoxal phosphate-dependent enzyme [Streptomyces gardneri]
MSAEAETAVDEALAARTAELSDNLAGLLARIDAACHAAGRSPESVRLLPVTKFFPASDVAILHRLGRREFGESREQEAAAKVAALRDEDLSGIRWHMIGRLQRNKARAVARWAHTVHSVDSERLATALDAGATAALEAGDRTEPVRVLLQVSLDDDPTRGGVAAGDLPALAGRIAEAPGLRLSGLMAIPPLGAESDAAFARLAMLHTLLLADHPDATELSAGMSGDLESAIEHGSTVVRVGTALMGIRPITSG